MKGFEDHDFRLTTEQAEVQMLYRRTEMGARDEMLVGTKSVRVPTASKASKLFTENIF